MQTGNEFSLPCGVVEPMEGAFCLVSQKGTQMDHQSRKGIRLRSMIIAGGIPTVTVMLAAFAIGVCIAVILF